MVKRLLLLSSVLFIAFNNQAQVYSYDFGSLQDSITSGSAVSPIFLPAPPDGASAYARVGSGNGMVVVKNFADFGTGSSLRLQAPTNGSINKFSVYDMPNASSTLGLKFTFSIGDSVNSPASDPSSGTLYFFTGNGANFSNASGFSGAQTFSGVRLTLGSGSAQLAVRVPLPPPSTSYIWATDPSNPIAVPYGVPTTVVLYMNNSAVPITYIDINSVSHTLPAGTADIFSNGSYLINVPSAGLASGTNLNAFMFYAESSSGNQANLFVDDIVYTNDIVSNILPLKLTHFEALKDNNTVRLFWKTEVESTIEKYIVEHSTDGIHFSGIGSVTSQHINGSSYIFTHTNPSAHNFYRLRILNFDGGSEYSQVIAVKMKNENIRTKMWYNDNALHINQHQNAEVKVYSLSGTRVLSTVIRNSEYAVDVSFLPPGHYIAHVRNEEETIVVKFVK